MATSVDGENGDDARGIIARVTRPFDVFISWMNSAGTVWVFLLMFLICADVLSRNILNAPIRGVSELVAYSIAGAVFLQLSHALHVGRFTRAEFLMNRLEARCPVATNVFNAIFNLCGLVVFLLIVNGGYAKFIEAWPDLKFGVEGEFTIPVWPLRAIITFGAILVALKFFILLLQSIAGIFSSLSERSGNDQVRPIAWGYIISIFAVIGLFLFVSQQGFEKYQIGALSFIAMLILIYLGMHIGVALVTLGFIGIWIMMGDTRIALNTVKLASNEFLRNYFLGVVPLFVLMGLLVSESDIGKDTFAVARWGLRKVKGGLGVATVVANAIFAAITGSSIASAAVFTKVATPEMMSHGYTPRFSVGVVAGSSVLGMLIPPSLLLIVYGFIAEQSVGILFIAAIIPGLILALAMGIAIVAMAHFWPAFVGNPTYDEMEAENVGSAFWKLAPILILIALVLGGIYGGLFTPVEAGAVGAAGALILAVAKRRLTWSKLWNVLIETGHATVSVLFLILAANIYGRMLALSGFPQFLGDTIAGADLGFYTFMALYILMLVVLGMFLDSISMMLIVLPLVLPIVMTFGADLVWFGIVTVIAVEMGLLTPPLGIAVYVVRSTIGDARVTLGEIFAGAFPFVLIMLFVTILLIAFPQLSLILL